MRIVNLAFWYIAIGRDTSDLSATAEFRKVGFDVKIRTCEKLRQNVEFQVKLEGIEDYR